MGARRGARAHRGLLVTALGAIIFVITILVCIGLHEFGHFITAKKFGIKVEQFFIGFGPRLWSVRKGETEYGVKALPFGGYVRIAGMNPFEEINPEDKDRVFKAKKPWQRAIVLGAGSFTHFLLGLVLVAVVLGAYGEQVPTTRIGGVQQTLEGKPGPAAAAGFRAGDVLVSIEGHPVHHWEDATEVLHASPGKVITVVVRRGRTLVTLHPRLADHSPSLPSPNHVGYLGIGSANATQRYGPISAVTTGAKRVGEGAWLSLQALGKLFSPSSLHRLFQEVAGTKARSTADPTTVVGVTGQAGGLLGHGDIAGFLYLIAYFNIFIGTLNLLPLPPLDGGHLAVLAYEKIRRREVDMRKLIPITVTVISVFGSLFLLLLYLDIVRPLPSIGG
ncbi:MAG TPA: site-2 protease family protein [Actinomycetota bacterium]|nr:site-2 protease family protein [Actinomycetota bacterium]